MIMIDSNNTSALFFDNVSKSKKTPFKNAVTLTSELDPISMELVTSPTFAAASHP
jgi:hypothetical protein